MFGLGRPAIHKVVADELYTNERLLIDEQAKLDHARLVARQHEARVQQIQSTIARLRCTLAATKPSEEKTDFYIEGLG